MKRRTFMIGGLFAQLGPAPTVAHQPVPDQHPDPDALDASIQPSNLPEEYQPSVVFLDQALPPFEIHVNPAEFALYWTLRDMQAIRYSVGIGRPGLYEAGEFYVGAKKKWPSWTPTPDMIRRQPSLYARHRNGMPGGPGNPLGARALYLFTFERGDTFLRIHGTDEPETIGTRVSNGCARIVNDQILDLYERTFLATRVVLYPTAA